MAWLASRACLRRANLFPGPFFGSGFLFLVKVNAQTTTLTTAHRAPEMDALQVELMGGKHRKGSIALDSVELVLNTRAEHLRHS